MHLSCLCGSYVGSDLQHLCTEAATRAAMETAPAVLRRHFEAALAQGRPAALTAQSVGVREAPGVTLRDVHGCARQVAEVRAAVLTPLERPDLLRRLGIAAPGGVLLHGPSGCGKTLLARAVAGEAAHLANFIPVQCSELVDKVG
ncbi:P-loop containing nucleoside triphosphate hydrolase protein [Tribonema minus]|uniref:P-loop containing nucleoside triphosphate hydrolase protein n=1 Tax=Tribonema minus TaxID=303371 RepID=A0A835Z9E1_9STRA|nr:P-loop containing nucleoside triphosphate hydrolase protein [Tribonema minus]